VGLNTECWTISNASGQPFFVVDGEDPFRTLTVPANGSNSFGGTIIPWCAESLEVERKAFRFFRAGAGAFYLFQLGSSTIATSPFAGPLFPGQALTDSASRIEVSIDAAGAPSVRAF
jgi:hypothetical protein